MTINTVSSVYPSFSGTIAGDATGSAATLQFDAAIFGGGGGNSQHSIAINFTNADGLTQDVLSNGPMSPDDPNFSSYYDTLTFFAAASGNAAIGTSCVASSDVACVAVTGMSQELSSIIASLNSGQGIFGDGTITVTINDTLPSAVTPEPGSLLLLATGTGALGWLRRRFQPA
ncbi:PEP-CTERM sorting domain-containing protein [Terriglobus sp.]|uniref:PEP-CTERM sorting domain-containing protein n=1 Tax=Terriglobus sp. TaxID=1889013 RepID=UPI003AFF89D6